MRSGWRPESSAPRHSQLAQVGPAIRTLNALGCFFGVPCMKLVSTQEFVQVRVLQQPFSFSPRAPVSKQQRGPRLPTDRSFPARDSRPADPGTVIVGAARGPATPRAAGRTGVFLPTEDSLNFATTCLL